MEQITAIKASLYGGLCLLGSFLSSVCGGWTSAMTCLLIIMGIDFLTGLMVAGVFKKSTKSEDGSISSKIGLIGISKKVGIVILVITTGLLESQTGSTQLRDGVVVAYIVNECISITENLGLMGVWIPAPLKNALSVLKSKSEDAEINEEGEAQ